MVAETVCCELHYYATPGGLIKREAAELILRFGKLDLASRNLVLNYLVALEMRTNKPVLSRLDNGALHHLSPDSVRFLIDEVCLPNLEAAVSGGESKEKKHKSSSAPAVYSTDMFHLLVFGAYMGDRLVSILLVQSVAGLAESYQQWVANESGSLAAVFRFLFHVITQGSEKTLLKECKAPSRWVQNDVCF